MAAGRAGIVLRRARRPAHGGSDSSGGNRAEARHRRAQRALRDAARERVRHYGSRQETAIRRRAGWALSPECCCRASRRTTNHRRVELGFDIAEMRFTVGTRVGPYEIAAQIGAGGMGEVYRARDTRLKRDVALKILPESFATESDRLLRFQREAEVLASLNHPNIAHVYGLEQSDGVQALVMELVEGPTLADRIAQGPIPVDEALPVADKLPKRWKPHTNGASSIATSNPRTSRCVRTAP